MYELSLSLENSGGGGASGEAATLVIAAGQSNAKGFSLDPQNTTALTNGLGYQFYPSGAGGVFLPLGRTGFGRTEGSPWAAFAQTWAAAAGGTVLLVDASVGGSSLISANKSALTGSGVTYSGGTWDLADGVNSLYNLWAKPQVQAAITAAEANGFDIRKIVVYWVQGETDGAGSVVTTTIAAYQTRLTAIVDQFAADFDIDAFLISLIGTNAGAEFTSGVNVRAAQTNVATTDRPLLADVAFSDAPNFFAAGKMVDNLHYTQAGYNEMGIGLATNGLAFLPAFSLPARDPAKFIELASALPAISGWKRIRFTTQATSFNPNIILIANSPLTTTWIDSTATNKMVAKLSNAALGWTFPSSVSKDVCLYVSDSNNVNCILLAASTDSLLAVDIPESGVIMGRFTLDDALLDGFAIQDADIANFAASALRILQIGKGSGRIAGAQIALTSAALIAQPNLTNLSLNGSGVPLVDTTLIPNVTNYAHARVGASVAEVNAVLVALDAAGASSRTVSIAQFLSGIYAAAAPTGDGAVAKASLITKSWTVVTD